MKERKTYTTGQVAKNLGVSLSTVRRWLERGEIKGFRLPSAGGWRITRQELVNFMERNAFPVDELMNLEDEPRKGGSDVT
jgi:two-component system response regulator VicR